MADKRNHRSPCGRLLPLLRRLRPKSTMGHSQSLSSALFSLRFAFKHT